MAPSNAAEAANGRPESTPVTIRSTAQPMAPAGITTRHHLPSTSPTSSNVGITCFSLSSLHLRRDAKMLTEKGPLRLPRHRFRGARAMSRAASVALSWRDPEVRARRQAGLQRRRHIRFLEGVVNARTSRLGADHPATLEAAANLQRYIEENT
jgi:hypothetical protein